MTPRLFIRKAARSDIAEAVRSRPSMHRALGLAGLALAALACGGDDGSGPNNNGNSNAKVLTATINGAPFSATTVGAAFFSGMLTISGVNGQQSLLINAINVTGPGAISLTMGNQWSALAQVIDGSAGQFSSGFGGTGTVTLTTVTPARVTGSFTFTAYTSAGTGLGKPVVTVQSGVFDITNP